MRAIETAEMRVVLALRWRRGWTGWPKAFTSLEHRSLFVYIGLT
jgi:hypothetical protein